MKMVSKWIRIIGVGVVLMGASAARADFDYEAAAGQKCIQELFRFTTALNDYKAQAQLVKSNAIQLVWSLGEAGKARILQIYHGTRCSPVGPFAGAINQHAAIASGGATVLEQREAALNAKLDELVACISNLK